MHEIFISLLTIKASSRRMQWP